ncbi:DUF4397 domain-containing protein [Paraferrimonas sedimenticola]|uniref:DUF4397 domain-containing protein n=1 Tax=Paraferrimonas sedimenticola TaxID=375674 RepID=A0AA37RZA2_9GAMM|nr:DUF4397 domain-containing protein [Paraferrimonas sedimenticola]GLP98060.1 hypothetical protein GCM10007895_33670 [Paraferrimonas sedimenticola]
MKTKFTLAVLSAALMVSACHDDDNNDGPVQLPADTPPPAAEEAGMSYVRVTHASADAPLVAIAVNGAVVEGLEMVDYQVGTGLLELESAAYDIAVNALLADGTSAPVIEANLDFAPDMQYDIIALNYAANIEPVVLARDAMGPGDGEIRLDVLHGHPDVGAVDIYLTTAESIDAEGAAIEGLEFKMDADALPVTVPADTYRIRIAPSGTKTVVFDSGNLDLAGGSDLMITAVPNTDGAMTAPVNLLVGDGTSVGVLRDANEQARVRVVHAVDDAPAVDVLASDTPVEGLTMIPFKEFRSIDLPAASYDLKVAASMDNSIVAIDAPGVEFGAGTTTSIYAVGKLNSITDNTIEPLVIAEDLRSVALYAKLRVVHASPTAGSLGLVDIHASADGNFSADTKVLEGVDFKGNATLNVPAGTYYLGVILQSDDTFTPAVSAMATVENGGVYSVVATDDFDNGLLLNVDYMKMMEEM